jgi:hypothetical protein
MEKNLMQYFLYLIFSRIQLTDLYLLTLIYQFEEAQFIRI